MEYLATTDRLRSSEIALRFRRNIRQNIESNLKKKKKKKIQHFAMKLVEP